MEDRKRILIADDDPDISDLLESYFRKAGYDVTITVNGKVVAKPCTVSTTNATVELGDLYTFSLVSAGSSSAWHSVALELSNCPVGTSRVTASFSGSTLKASEHVFSILATDSSGHPLPLYYTKNTSVAANADGTIQSVTLSLDKGETIPDGARFYVLADTYPVFVG